MRFLRTCLLFALLGVTFTGSSRLVSPKWADTPAQAATPAHNLTATTREAVELLAGADTHGLNPEHYRVTVDPADVDAFEAALNVALRRYLGDLSAGRVNPASLGHHLPALPREAAVAGGPSAAVKAATPTVGNYEGVRHALATYRAIALQPEPPALPTDSRSIRVGESLPWAAALRARLETFGDLDPAAGDSSALDGVYSPALEAGVKSFQHRHSLTDDGVLGKATIAALNVPVATRVRQLELALERLRWLRRDLEGPAILVNIPMFQLWAYDDVRAAAPAMTMKVVVGTRGRNATPVFVSTMERVVFRPYWNVPRSIVLGEILPKAKADPTYLAAHRYELVRGQGDRSPVVEANDAALQELEQGTLRLRQRPGTSNSLGLIKFDFPNDHDVFLHDTPTRTAFLRDVRTLSHGCVRVERPVDLASWVLASSIEAVQESTRGKDAQVVQAPRPVQVLLTYSTAAVDADGTVRFAQDIYGHDTRLEKALMRLPSGPAFP